MSKKPGPLTNIIFNPWWFKYFQYTLPVPELTIRVPIWELNLQF